MGDRVLAGAAGAGRARPAAARYRLHKLPSIMASASRMTLQEALPLRELQVTTLIVNSDTDDGSLDLQVQGSASDIDVSHVFILPSLISFCEVRCFKI